MSKHTKTDVAIDVVETLQGLDNDYNDDLGLVLSLGADSEDDRLAIGQVFYDDGTTADVEIRIKVTSIQKGGSK